jgi:hypothetical protein
MSPLPLALLPTILDTPDWLFNSLFFRLWKIDPKARSSMNDDLAAGRKTEHRREVGPQGRPPQSERSTLPGRAFARSVVVASDGCYFSTNARSIT